MDVTAETSASTEQARPMVLLNEDQEFEQAISSSTGVPQGIRKRFAVIRGLVQELV